MYFQFLIFLLKFASIISLKEADLEVKTDYGTFVGQETKNYIAYEGIAYAQPPINDLRFEPPISKPKTPEEQIILNGTTPCLHWNPFTEQIEGNEDCLYLNVYKPKAIVLQTETNTKLLPVIFHIHGGAWSWGTARDFGEKILMVNQNLIYVNFNYRLGVFGFLSNGEKTIPGNMGFKDQVMALTWIQENIEAFGGDKDNIIITGFSAGAASVHLFYLSPMTKDKFAAGISHSGTALAPWVLSENNTQKFDEIMNIIECQNKSLICLKSQSGETIVKAAMQLKKFEGHPVVPFGLTIEPNDSERPFLTETPLTLLKKEEVAKKPWLTSITLHEGGYFVAPWVEDETRLTYINDYWNDIAPILFMYEWIESEDERNNVSQRIKEHYIKADRIDSGKLQELSNIFTDRYFALSEELALQYMAPLMPTYFYRFKFKGSYGFGEFLSNDKPLGVAHGEDIQFIYSTPIRMDKPFTENEEKISDTLVSIYNSFAITGIPKMAEHEFPPTAFDQHGNIHFLDLNSPDDVQDVTMPQSAYAESTFWEATIHDEL